jgi:hypothetical protein
MKIWQIATGEAGRDYRSLFFDYDIMIIGSSHEFGNAFDNADKYKNETPNSEDNQVLSFANKPKPGDRVLMRYKKEVIGIGQIPMDIENQYSFRNEFKCVYGWNLCHTRRVIWTDENLPDKIRHIFKDRKQQPTFTEVHESLKKYAEELSIKHFNRPLKELPNINFNNYNEDELGIELFKKGISNKNIDDIIKSLNQADRLKSWYLSDNSGRTPTENEVISHMILPIFLGLGWSHQQIAIEWNKVDVAFFKKTPTIEKNCVMILEAKGLGKSLGDVLNQPREYVKTLKLNNVKSIVTTDGANVFVYSIENNKVNEEPIGFFNINHLQREYVLPKNINLVDTLVQLQPTSI